MLGEVAGTFEVSDHAQGRDQRSQVRRDGLLAGEDVEGTLLDVRAKRVNRVVGRDHVVGQLHIRVDQRLGGPAHGTADEPGHLDQRVGKGVEVLVVDVPHRRVPTPVDLCSASSGAWWLMSRVARRHGHAAAPACHVGKRTVNIQRTARYSRVRARGGRASADLASILWRSSSQP